MEVPKVGESRIMSNFDGSLDQVSTLAHELAMPSIMIVQ
jgi:oligoendopeptidase F